MSSEWKPFPDPVSSDLLPGLVEDLALLDSDGDGLQEVYVWLVPGAETYKFDPATQQGRKEAAWIKDTLIVCYIPEYYGEVL